MYPLIRLFYAVSSLFSFNALRRIGMCIGSIYCRLSPSRRKIAEINARIIGAANPEETAASSFRHSFATFAESMFSHRVTQEFADSIEVEYISENPVDTAKPCFLVTAHIGCWELSGVIFTMKFKTKLAAIGRKMKNEKVTDYIVRQRENSSIIHISHRDVAEKVPECLDSGISIGALLDHSAVEKDSIFVPFFGLNTTFIKGIPMLAVRRNTDILPAFLIRTEKSYKLVVYPRITPDRNLKPKERIFDTARRVNETYEDIIRKYPDQWYLLHKRFKKIMDENGKVTDSFYRQDV